MTERDLASIGRRAAPTPGPRAERAREAVRAALDATDGALAAWEAGSAAFGRADLDSDLDVGVLCTGGTGTDVLDAIERELESLRDEIVTWDVGRSAFGVQRFWRPAPSVTDPVACMVDVSVMELDAERDLWRELLSPERHGKALSLHDPDDVLRSAIEQAGLDLDAHRDRIRAELVRIAGRHRMFHDFPAKELDRGRDLDAHLMHDSMVVGPLVSLLGIVHRPLRFDFGHRYLHEELPVDVVDRLLAIARPSVGALVAANEAGQAWIDELLAGIDVDALPLDEHAFQMREAFGND